MDSFSKKTTRGVYKMALKDGFLTLEGFTLKDSSPDECVFSPTPDQIDTYGTINISHQTTLADFKATFDAELFESCAGGILTFTMLFLVEGQPFDCTFYLDKRNRLSEIHMFPCIPSQAEDWDLAKQQEERRQFCSQWLRERLGAPAGSAYTLDNIHISIVENTDPFHGPDGGFIGITYLRQGVLL